MTTKVRMQAGVSWRGRLQQQSSSTPARQQAKAKACVCVCVCLSLLMPCPCAPRPQRSHIPATSRLLRHIQLLQVDLTPSPPVLCVCTVSNIFGPLAGRWKPLAYSVKRMYAPLQVQAFQDGKNFKVFLVNDRVTPIATTVTVSVLSLDQNSTSSCPAAQSGAAATHTLGVDPVAKTDFTVPPSFASQVGLW